MQTPEAGTAAKRPPRNAARKAKARMASGGARENERRWRLHGREAEGLRRGARSGGVVGQFRKIKGENMASRSTIALDWEPRRAPKRRGGGQRAVSSAGRAGVLEKGDQRDGGDSDQSCARTDRHRLRSVPRDASGLPQSQRSLHRHTRGRELASSAGTTLAWGS